MAVFQQLQKLSMHSSHQSKTIALVGFLISGHIGRCRGSPGGGLEEYAQEGIENAPYSQARIYWIGSCVANFGSMLTLLHAVASYAFNPLWQRPSVRAFIPKLVGDAFWVITVGPHHLRNALRSEDDYRTHKLGFEDGDWSCEIMRGVVVSFVVQFCGFVFIAWAPVHIVKQAKLLRLASVTRKHILAAIMSATLVGFLWIWGHAADFGDWRGVYCGTKTHRSHTWVLPAAGGVVLTYTFVMLFALKLEKELVSITQSSSAKALAAEAKRMRKCSLIILNQTLLLWFPYVLVMILDFFCGVVVTVPVFWLAGWLMKANGAMDGIVLRFYVHWTKTMKTASDASILAGRTWSKRSTKFDVSEPVNRAISIGFVIEFARSRAIGSGLTTVDVMEQYIKKETAACAIAYIDLAAWWVDDRGVEAVGKVWFFVSHSWGSPFANLLGQIAEMALKIGGSNEYFWIDIFAINQHRLMDALELPSLQHVIASSVAVLLTVHPWDQPATLDRVWCLWEILKATTHNIPLELVMIPDQEVAFLEAMRTDYQRVASALSIDVQNASATKAHDKVAILEEIKDTVGIASFNKIVKEKVQGCFQLISVTDSLGIRRRRDMHTPMLMMEEVLSDGSYSKSLSMDVTRHSPSKACTIGAREVNEANAVTMQVIDLDQLVLSYNLEGQSSN